MYGAFATTMLQARSEGRMLSARHPRIQALPMLSYINEKETVGALSTALLAALVEISSLPVLKQAKV